MKRKIAMLLAVIMLINVMPPINIFAGSGMAKTSSLLGFVERKYGIAFNGQNITPDSEGAPALLTDQAGVEWYVSNKSSGAYNNGLYRLTYYLFDNLTSRSTKRVEVDFKVGQPNEGEAEVSVRLYDENNVQETLNYVQLNGAPGPVSPAKEFKTVLKIKNEDMYKDKELELKVGNYSTIKLHIKAGRVQLTSTGILEGHITPYQLQFSAGYDGNFSITEKLEVFKGVQALDVVPQHINIEQTTAGHIVVSKERLTQNEERPGSRPGVKVEFELPKIIVGGKFISMTTAGASNEFATLSLEEEFLAEGDTQVRVPKQVSFKLQDGAAIYDGYDLVGATKPIGNVYVKDGKVTLYIVESRASLAAGGTDPAYQNVVKSLVEWPQLKSGMIMQSYLTFKGGRFANLETTTFRPINLGHTYIDYTASKIEGGDIAFEITPYQINGPVTYQLKFKRDGGKWVDGPSVYYADGSKKDKKLTLTTKAANTEYQICVTTGGKDDVRYEYKSQILKYDPSTEATPPPLPEILSVDNVYVVPDGQNPQTEQPQAVGFDISWRAPSATDIDVFLKDGGELYYELYLHNSSRTESVPIKIFKVSKEKAADGKESVTLKPYVGRSGEGTYNTRQDSFNMQNVVLKQNGENGWEWINGMPDDYLTKKDYPAAAAIPTEDTLGYKVPGTYYFSMRAVTDPGTIPGTPTDEEKRLAVSQESNLKSIALDTVNEIIPTTNYIDSVSSSVENNIAQKIIFSHVNLSKYIRYMLDPVALTLGGTKGTDRTYEVYFYQDQSIKESDFKNAKVVTQDATGKVNLSPEDLEALRNSKQALRVDYVSSTNDANEKADFIVNGLEPNQVYYVQIRVKLDVLDKGTMKPLPPARYSLFSKIYSFTTSTVPLPPTPDEQIPPAPGKLFVDEVINNTAVRLGWEPPLLDDGQKEEVFYEFVRSTDAEIPGKYLGRELTIDQVLGKNGNYKGFTTHAPKDKDPYIYTYKGTVLEKLIPEQLAANLRLTDQTLMPNTVYYYYVRTVQKIQGKNVASQWIMMPVTTTPVEPPIKLKIESKEAYSYNPKNQTVVSFWAPIPSGGKVPEEYSFDIAVKGEKDDDFRLDYTIRQLKELPVDQFYKQYVYIIDGLKPGSRYDIKVRIKDKTKPKPTAGDYPTSLYSDKVICRTEFDDDEGEKDEAFEEYLKKYDQEAEKLKRKPYWEVGHEKYRGVYKYRETYLQSELANSHTYPLVVAENASQAYYYLPATTFKTAQSNQTLIKVQLEDTTIHLRPQTLTEKNKDVIDAVNKMSDKKIKDYYIGVQVLLYDTGTSINGTKAISPEITIDLKLVYLEEEDRLVEDDIMAELVKLIDKGRLNVIDDLEREVDKGRIEEARLDAIIQREIKLIQDKHCDKVKTIMKDVIDREYFVGEVDQPMLVTQAIKGHGVSGYYKNNGWESVYAMMTNGGYAIEATKLGTYVFAGKTSTTPILPEIPGAQDMISKYQLTDFISLSSDRLGWYTTKSQAYGSLARILGASRGVDYVEYLKQRGIKDINRIGMDQAIRQDELVYLVMQAYEKITYKSLDQIMISNKQSVMNIGAFQPKHRQAIYVAVQLGVITPEGQKVSPSQGVTNKAFLQMLSKIVSK